MLHTCDPMMDLRYRCVDEKERLRGKMGAFKKLNLVSAEPYANSCDLNT
jgi:hypothetical protein